MRLGRSGIATILALSAAAVVLAVTLAAPRPLEGEIRRDERAWLEIRALVDQAKIAAARDAAVVFFAEHPDSPLAARVEALTGVHPRPRPPGTTKR